MSESDVTITSRDYLSYRSCPRLLHRRLIGEPIPTQSDADALYPVESDRVRVRMLARRLFPGGREADEAPDVPIAFNARCLYHPFVAQADILHPQKPDGTAAVLVREATSIKESYLYEAAFLDYCFTGCGAEPRRIFVYHVNKQYERSGGLDPEHLFVARDVTRRVRKLLPAVTAELERLRSELQEDPALERYRDELCTRARSCPVCSRDLPEVVSGHVSTLHRGGPLVRELLDDGFELITDVPTDRLAHPRQAIQQRALRDRRPHVDREALRSFLGRLEPPVGYLDFEATSTAIPPFDRVHSWEHIPYLYSLHRESPDGLLSHSSFICEPGADGRAELVERLVRDADGCRSLVVYSAGFERGILRRLVQAVPERAGELEALIDRLVDLLEPFSQFSFYHHEQDGKVSLKTVLPVLTSHDYSGEEVRDGYTAHLAYRYLSESPGVSDADRRELLAALTSYCALDTMAMVRIVRELRTFAHDSTA